MAVLTRQTCALAIELLKKHRTMPELELLLYRCDVPDNIIVGTSKLSTLHNVFKLLERDDPDKRLRIILAAIADLGPELALDLSKALQCDGFVEGGCKPVSDEPIVQEQTAPSILVSKPSTELDEKASVTEPLSAVPTVPNKPCDIFLSYSHDDEQLMTLVRQQLVVYDRQGLIAKWWDRKILPGSPLDGMITQHLSSSEIILLFVSASFLASDYCYEVEMTQALRQHKEGSSVVVPVILRHCNWHVAPFGNLLALPTDGRPLAAWPDRDEAAKNIADGVMRIVADLQNR